MKAILPAAGFGTRMYPLTLDKPKALLEINGKPVIEYILSKISELKEIDEIFIISNNKFYEKFKEWKDSFSCSLEIKIVNNGIDRNEERHGAIGDIYSVLKKEGIYEDFLLVHGDNLFSFDLGGLVKSFMATGLSTIALYDVGNLESAKKFGNVLLDGRGRIKFFKEKSSSPRGSLCSVGIYVFPSWIVGFFREYSRQGNSLDNTGSFLEWLYKNEDIYGYVFDKEKCFWFDIGSRESYEEANAFLGGTDASFKK